MLSENRINELSAGVRIASAESANRALAMAIEVVRTTPGLPANAAEHLITRLTALREEESSKAPTAAATVVNVTDSRGTTLCVLQTPKEMSAPQANQFFHQLMETLIVDPKSPSDVEKMVATLTDIGFVRIQDVVAISLPAR